MRTENNMNSQVNTEKAQLGERVELEVELEVEAGGWKIPDNCLDRLVCLIIN